MTSTTMTGDRLYNLGMKCLRIFHWGLFFILVEMMFFYAGWMLFGIAGNALAWAIFTATGNDVAAQFAGYSYPAGKATGLVAGLGFTRYVMGRYFQPPKPPAPETGVSL